MQHTRSLFSIRPWGIVLAFLLFCLIPLTALGYSITDEASFNKLCKWCTTTDATLYDRRPVYDENGRETGWEFVPIGTIASGKRVSSLAEIDGKYNIFYWSGGRKDAYVDPGTFSLTPALKACGLSKVFTPAADFSGFSDEPLYLSDMIQRCYVKADEEGTEAAAVTMAIMVQGCAAPSPNMPKEITFDRPFIWVITDLNTAAAPYFMGITEKP